MTDERRKYEHKLQKCSRGRRGSTRRRGGAISIARRLRRVDCLPVGAVSDCVGPVRGGNVVSPDAEAVLYGVLAKPGFGALLLWGHRNIGILPSFPFSRRALSHPYIRTVSQLTQISPPTPTDMPDLGLHVRYVAETHGHVEKTGDHPAATGSGGRVGGLMRRRGENGASNGAGNGAVAAGADADADAARSV